MEKQNLTPGRWRGLKNTSHPGDVFGILAFDQRGSYRRMLPENTSFDEAVRLKRDVIRALSPGTSAVLLDYVYGIQPALSMENGTGLLMALEESGYEGEKTSRTMKIEPDWSVEKIKAIGSEAIKFLVYYNPDAGSATDRTEDLVRQVILSAHRYDIPVYLEPLIYSTDDSVEKDSADFAAKRPELVVETARRLGALGPDVLKMEFPVDIFQDNDREAWKRHCKRLTDAAPVPWVLLSAGVDFDDFVSQLEIASDAGASGYLAGRAIWKEVVTLNSEDRQKFLNDVAYKRVLQLNEIVAERAVPWTDYFSYPSYQDDWYREYKSFV
jgi:tagatose 1,6-diphosphate aldolase